MSKIWSWFVSLFRSKIIPPVEVETDGWHKATFSELHKEAWDMVVGPLPPPVDGVTSFRGYREFVKGFQVPVWLNHAGAKIEFKPGGFGRVVKTKEPGVVNISMVDNPLYIKCKPPNGPYVFSNKDAIWALVAGLPTVTRSGIRVREGPETATCKVAWLVEPTSTPQPEVNGKADDMESSESSTVMEGDSGNGNVQGKAQDQQGQSNQEHQEHQG